MGRKVLFISVIIWVVTSAFVNSDALLEHGRQALEAGVNYLSELGSPPDKG